MLKDIIDCKLVNVIYQLFNSTCNMQFDWLHTLKKNRLIMYKKEYEDEPFSFYPI